MNSTTSPDDATAPIDPTASTTPAEPHDRRLDLVLTEAGPLVPRPPRPPEPME